MFALRMQGVVKRYGRTAALNGLSLEIPTGSLFGLVGSNGAGKTTFLSIASGLVREAEGTIELLGGASFDPAVHAGRVTLLPQDSGLPYYARVGDLLHYYARLQGLSSSAAKASVRDVLSWVNLADRIGSKVRTLSHGMMRRVTVAQAFLGDPELILLDEPMSGLDPAEVVNIRRLLRERAGRQTILVSSHMLKELEQLCDHVAIIEKGRTVCQDTMQAFTRHSHRVVYRLGGDPPLDVLRDRTTDCEFDWQGDARMLCVTYPDEHWDAERINTAVLRVLLDADCPVREVSCGSDLETEYLKSKAES